jgi:hypothetical protein
LTAKKEIISKIKKNLERCGYTNQLLRTDYVYADKVGSYTLPLAGFARPVYDTRTACVSVIVAGDLTEVKAEYINRYRGFGAPVVFVCCNGTMQWWAIRTERAEWKGTFKKAQLDDFFTKRKEDLRPERLWRAKNLGRVDRNQQLEFVDIGLMPLLEDEMGERLGHLMKRVIGSLRKGFTEDQLKKAVSQRWTFQAAFWLLCAKILKDKGVKNFKRLNLADTDAVIEAVTTHYGALERINVGTQRQTLAFEEAAGKINEFPSLSNLTTEAFGYMYENLFVDKKLRSFLGIHATPSYLVDYIVWQLWPWIREIPEEKRIVLEPACGHAPFLAGAMRLLRELFEGDEKAFHQYAKKHLRGIEVDPFAREIARLSLTIADVPNPNGWHIMDGDIYRSDVISKHARGATILLCNPPFEDFKPKEQDDAKSVGEELKSYNKAAEMLWRTLPFMPEGSVFGVILPRGFLNKTNLTRLREMIVGDFDIQQICHLPKKVFRHAAHESVVLSGRKREGKTGRVPINRNRILYRHVSRDRLDEFQEKYACRDQYVAQSIFLETPVVDLRLVELPDLWGYCEKHFSKLDSISEGGQGLIYRGEEDLPQGAKTFDKERFRGAVKGYALFDSDVALHQLPEVYWMNLDPEVIRRPMWGFRTGKPQILMNYAPVGSEPWRLKALIDKEGWPVTSRFLVFRTTSQEWSLNALWGVLNSPLVNGFIYAHTTDRDITTGIARRIPIPHCSKKSLEKIERLVGKYFNLREKEASHFGVDVRDTARRILLSIDAEVMRLYDLPPKMEKRILDLFQGVQRKGVDFEFKGYYPEGFESAVPLHEFLSEEYQRSTVSFVKKWVEDNRSPEIIKAFETAVEAFQDE